MTVASDIVIGKYDSELDDIRSAIHRRREILAQANFFELKIGDHVRFKAGTRPTYMVGLTGRITGHKQKKVMVRIDPGQYAGRFAGSDEITTPVSIIEKYNP